jgi:hypothetical protein
LEIRGRLGGEYLLHIQSHKKQKQKKTRVEHVDLLAACLLMIASFDIFFGHEVEDNMFLRNVC